MCGRRGRRGDLGSRRWRWCHGGRGRGAAFLHSVSLFFSCFDCALSTTIDDRRKKGQKLDFFTSFLAMGDADSDAPLVLKNNYW